MDSVALAFWLKPPHAVTVDYGQLPAAAEIRAASRVCAELNISHHVVRTAFPGHGDMAGAPSLPGAPTPEWWPFRNQMLITIAAAELISHGVTQLIIGTLAPDRVNGDGSPEFLKRIDDLLHFQEGGMRLIAPAIELTATELIRQAGVPEEIIRWAHSCHISDNACGRCRGCLKQRRTLREMFP
jgi:7-cyano-7-deazaguanine synthase